MKTLNWTLEFLAGAALALLVLSPLAGHARANAFPAPGQNTQQASPPKSQSDKQAKKSKHDGELSEEQGGARDVQYPPAKQTQAPEKKAVNNPKSSQPGPKKDAKSSKTQGSGKPDRN